MRRFFLTSFRGIGMYRTVNLRLRIAGGVCVCVCICICKYHVAVYCTLDSLHAGPSQAKSGGIVPLFKAKNNILTSREQRSVQGKSSWDLQDIKNLERTEFNRRKPICTSKKVFETCMSLIGAWLVCEKLIIVITVGYVMSSYHLLVI